MKNLEKRSNNVYTEESFNESRPLANFEFKWQNFALTSFFGVFAGIPLRL